MSGVSPIIRQNGFGHRLTDAAGLDTSTGLVDGGNWSQNVDTIFRYRTLLSDTAGATKTANYTFGLAYQINGTGGFLAVSTTTPIQAVASAIFADDDLVTSSQITGTKAGTFVNGRGDENGAAPSTGNITLGANHTEIEWSLRIDSAQVNNGDTIEIRVPADTVTSATWATITVVEANQYSMVADPGAYTLTGSDAGLLDFRKVTADAGSYALTGYDVTLSKAANLSLTAEAGSFTLTGYDSGLYLARLVGAGEGAFAITGSDASLELNRVVTANAGSYNLTGSDVTLTVTGGGAITLTADAGSFTLTGEDVGLYAARVVTADPGAYSYTGSDVTLTYTQVASLSITAEAGNFQLTGSDATLTYVPLEEESGQQQHALGRLMSHGRRGKRRRRARYWWEEEEQETEITPEVISLSPPTVKQEVVVPRVRFHAEPEKPQVNLAPMMRAMRKRAKMKLAAMIALDMLDE